MIILSQRIFPHLNRYSDSSEKKFLGHCDIYFYLAVIFLCDSTFISFTAASSPLLLFSLSTLFCHLML